MPEEELRNIIFDLQHVINQARFELKIMTGKNCIDYGRILSILETKTPTLP